MLKRIFGSINKEKYATICAAIAYVLIVLWFIGVRFSKTINSILLVICLISLLTVIFYSFIKLVKKGKKYTFWEKVKQFFAAFKDFIVVSIIMNVLISVIFTLLSRFQIFDINSASEVVNQAACESSLMSDTRSFIIEAVLIAPVIEETIFRFLPRHFFKSKWLYIILSTIVFSAMHVIEDPLAYVYIWVYFMKTWYYAYAYYETDDIRISMFLHMCNNLFSIILILCF